MKMHERKVIEERRHKIFILVHSNLSYIRFVKATWAWLCTISKDLQSIHPYTFKICKNTTKDSWITQESHQHSTNPRADLETTRHTHKAWERSNLSGSTAQPTTNHFLQASIQAKSSKNSSKMNLQLLQIVWSRRKEFPKVSKTKSRSKMINRPLIQKSQLL